MGERRITNIVLEAEYTPERFVEATSITVEVEIFLGLKCHTALSISDSCEINVAAAPATFIACSTQMNLEGTVEFKTIIEASWATKLVLSDEAVCRLILIDEIRD